MPKKEWRSINDFYYRRLDDIEQKAKPMDVADEPPPKKKEPEVRLLKGVWIAGDEGFDFNKKCKAQVTARLLRETKNKKVTINTFVKFKDDKEDLKQSLDGHLDGEGNAVIEVMLFYGDKYKQAISKNPDDNVCHYIFTATHENCTGELESEQLEMPFLPLCLKEREKNKAQMNKEASENGSTMCSNDCETCEKKAECYKQGETCDYWDECEIRDSCKKEEPQQSTQEENKQESQAQMNKEAAESGTPCTKDCDTCENKETCGK